MIDSTLFSFLWGGNDKVKRKGIINDISEGGLNMVHFESFVNAKNITWVNRLLDDSNHD